MKIAHLSDTHLGFRSLNKVTAHGMNQREVDVMLNFGENLDSILAEDPDLVIHSGDLFHVVRPSNHTINEANRLLMEFQRARDWRPLVLVGGNHDTPKTADIGNIQRLIAQIPGVRFAAQGAERMDFPELDCEVLCVPSNALVSRENISYRPALGRRYSILSVHGMAAQALPRAVEASHADFNVDDLHSDMFTYVALGDYHVFSEYAPNCCFAGSTDFTSSNIWEETGTPKGWVLFDTTEGRLRQVVVATRPVTDLPVIDADGLAVDEVATALRFAAAFIEDGAIVRQRVENMHAIDRQALHQSSEVREISAKCLNYQLRVDPPRRDRGKGIVTPSSTGAVASGSLDEVWKAHAETALLPESISMEAFTNAGLKLLQEVRTLEVA